MATCKLVTLTKREEDVEVFFEVPSMKIFGANAGFGKNIYSYRKFKGLTSAEISHKAELNRQFTVEDCNCITNAILEGQQEMIKQQKRASLTKWLADPLAGVKGLKVNEASVKEMDKKSLDNAYDKQIRRMCGLD
jgi:hypothetical protein